MNYKNMDVGDLYLPGLAGLEDKIGMLFIDSPPGHPDGVLMGGPEFARQISGIPAPARIEAKVPLRIVSMKGKQSDAVGRGEGNKGVVAFSDVKAGDLIFKISEPLLTFAHDGEEALKGNCDNCFAVIAKLGAGHKLWTQPVENPTLSACSGCKVVYYCGKACQKEAWKHHHKFECKTLLAMKHPNFVSLDGISLITQDRLRYMIRLVQLHRNDLIPQDFWDELENLPAAIEYREKEWPQFTGKAWMYADIIKSLIDTPLKENDIVQHMFIMVQNMLQIWVPLLKGGCKWYGPTHGTCFDVGYFVDPFVSKVRHSCVANAWCVFDGKELHVRALKDIAAGNEITFSYVSSQADYEDREWKLKYHWNIKCECSLCQKGLLGPTEKLREKVTKLVAMEIPKAGCRITQIERAIGDMKANGFDNGDQLMLSLHKTLLGAYMFKKQSGNALKTALKIYYLLEPITVPEIPLEARLMSLFNIIAHCYIPEDKLGLEPLPNDIRALIPAINLHLKQHLVDMTEKCFGADSKNAKFERWSLNDCIKWITDRLQGLYIYRPVREDEEER